MEPEDNLPRPGDPLAMLTRQDLDPFSVDELTARIGMLEREIARIKAHLARVVEHRSSADALFKR